MFERIAPLVTPFSRELLLATMGLVFIVMCVRIVRKARKSASQPAARRPLGRAAAAPAPRVEAPRTGATSALVHKSAPVAATSQREPVQLAPSGPAPAIVAERIVLDSKTRRIPFGLHTSTRFDRADAGAWRGSPLSDGASLAFGSVTPLLAELLPESAERRQTLSRSLQNAGYYSVHAWQNLAAVRCLGIIVPILACLAALVLAPESLEPWIMIGLVCFPLVGWSLPTVCVRTRAKSRLEEMSRAMPDLLDLLNMCVSQGMTVPTALSRVGSELQPVYPALAKELKIVTEQARIGSLEQALRGFSSRVDVPEVHSFTSLMIQTEQMGTSMSESLAEYSDNMRESFRQRADEKANSATFKMLFPTVLCLMPAVFMFLLGPSVVELNEFFSGRGQDVLRTSAAAAQLVTQEAR